jgi:hypothetical protein
MTDTTRPSRGARTYLRRSIRPEETIIPVLSTESLNLDTRKKIAGKEFIRCTGKTKTTLTGCERGVSREDGGSEARSWKGGESVIDVPWTTVEIVTEIPDPPTPAMAGRQFIYKDVNGDMYTFNVFLYQDGTAYIDWVNEPPPVDEEPGAEGTYTPWELDLTTGIVIEQTGVIGLAVDGSGNVYLTQMQSNNITARRKFNSALVQQWALGGFSDDHYQHCAVSGSNLVTPNRTTGIIADNNLYVFATSNGNSVDVWGDSGAGNGVFDDARGICADSNHVWVCDFGNNRVQKLTNAGVYVAQIPITKPRGIAVKAGVLYILARGSVTQVHKYDKTTHAFIETLAFPSGTADGQLSATAEGIDVDTQGRIWISDTGNHRVQVFDADGLFLVRVGTFGNGTNKLNTPKQIVVLSDTEALVADYGNDLVKRVTLTEPELILTVPFVAEVTNPEDGDILVYAGDTFINTLGGMGLGIFFAGRTTAAQASTDMDWTAMPSAKTELFGATAFRRLLDLSRLSQISLSVEMGATAGIVGATLALEYATDLFTPVWTAIPGTAVSIANASGWTSSGWASIPAGARGVVQLRVVGTGGNNILAPRIVSVVGQAR